MALRDKTNQRFKDFFEKQFKRYEGNEFEIPYSEIQRDTGAANSTMKRAIQALVEEGWLQVKPGRNSRYGVFKLLKQDAQEEQTPAAPESFKPDQEALPEQSWLSGTENPMYAYELRINELEHVVESLRRRLRNQEMTIALVQDRVAELEDKLFKK